MNTLMTSDTMQLGIGRNVEDAVFDVPVPVTPGWYSCG